MENLTIQHDQPWRDWSGILQEILEEIAVRLHSVEDFMAFRGVCTSWRSAPSKGKFINPRPLIPLLMLGESYGDSSHVRRFCNMKSRTVAMWLPLPEAKGKLCLGTRFGWLLTFKDSGETNLLNPFSRATIPLPSGVAFISRAVLSADPSQTSDFDLAVIHTHACFLSLWRSSDSKWISIGCGSGSSHKFLDVNYHNGKLYAIDTQGQVWVWDALTSTVKVDHALSTTEDGLSWRRDAYLVGSSSGKLLVVTHEFFHLDWVRVIELDVTRRQRKRIMNLGEDAIFVGCISAGVSIQVSAFPNEIESGVIKSNYIYFANPRGIQKFCLEESLKRLNESYRVSGPLVWISF